MSNSKKTKSNNLALRLFRDRKGATVLAVLFCLLFGAIAHAEDVLVINNAALKSGQSMTIKAFRGEDDPLKPIKKIVVGPVAVDCTNGCGSEPLSFSAAAGTYKIEVTSDTTPEVIAIAFPVQAGEGFTWMISNRTNPPSIRVNASDVQVLADGGPYRIDLVSHTKVSGTATAAPAPVAQQPRKKKISFWPFKPYNKHAPVNK